MGGDRPPHGLLFRTVSVGEAHACGITREGAAVCWGDNGKGETAVPERGANKEIESWSSVATHHRHSCGVTGEGELLCWGLNAQAQCYVPAGFTWLSVSTGHSHSCGLTADRLLRCWGHLTFGLGNAPPGYRWAELSVGHYHACGLVEGEGAVLCWGMNYHGETDVPEGFRFWQGCEGLGSAALRAVQSEHKAGKLACPQHELLLTTDGFSSRDGVELRCAEVDCASFGWSREAGAEQGRAWFCQRDYFQATDNALFFPQWEVGRPVTHCAPAEGDVKLSAYPSGELQALVQGAWGTVCRLGLDDGSMVAASVVCRQLGYVRALRTYSYVGAPHLAQSVRGVRCTGAEGGLLGCAPASEPHLCSHAYGDVGVQCAAEPGTPTPSPCGSGHAATIRAGAGEARALLLHGSVATGSEPAHSFDGRLRYTSGGFASHGRLRADGGAYHSAPVRLLPRPLALTRAQAAASACCAGLLVALVAAALRRRRRVAHVLL